MGIFAQFKTSKIAEENGIECKFKANEDGTIPTFFIARACRSNVRWTKAYETYTRPFKTEIDDKTISEDEAHKINVKIFCNSILTGWKNIQDESGKNIEFSFDNAVALFIALPDLYEKLDENSKEMSNFLEVAMKEDEKN